MRVFCVCGARPNFMKIAAVVRGLAARELEAVVVHTGQHYDAKMSKVMFEDLGLPEPDVNLEVGSASHAVQTAEVMKRFEPLVVERRPDLVLVVGDVNSTAACSLVAAKLGVAVAHVEAGLRSFDRSMPEEINRLVTDSISDLLFCSEPSGLRNLKAEGVPDGNVFFAGNVMIDTLLAHRERAEGSDVLERLGVAAGEYVALTLHRPANVDDPATLGGILDALAAVGERAPIVFPAHPRTMKRVDEHGLRGRLEAIAGLRVVEPLGYLDFLRLTSGAGLVLTDSGGIQEETTVLRIPCLTLRENTERPATVDAGTNELVGSRPERIVAAFERRWGKPVGDAARVPERWDGQAGARIAAVLAERGPEGLAALRAARAGGGPAVAAGAAAR